MNIGIIGAGATGLVAGYELVKKGYNVTVFETAPEVGGLASTIEIGGQKLERFYHHIFTSDTYVVELIEELGLDRNLIWKSPSSATFINGKLYPFSSPIDLLLFKEIPFIERLALGFLIFRSRFINDWDKLEKISAKDWIIKNTGQKTYDKYWGPLLNSKFDSDADTVSAAWLWNKFKLRGSTRGKSLDKEMFGYLKGSFGLLYNSIAQRISEQGGKINLSCKVTDLVQRDDKTVDVVTEKGTFNFQKVIVTSAPDTLLNFNLDFPREYKEKLQKIKYKADICAIFEIDNQISPYYWITVAEKDFPFVAVIEHTNLMDKNEYGTNLVYLTRYLDESNVLYKKDDTEIKTLFSNYLRNMFKDFNPASIKDCHISRARYAQPVVVKEYSKIIPDIVTPIPNLYLASMAQIYPEDRGQNYSIRMGRQIAELLQQNIETKQKSGCGGE